MELTELVPELTRALRRWPRSAGELPAARVITLSEREQAQADEPHPGHLGFLIVEGFLQRRLLVEEDGEGLELLGPSDLLRPWAEDAASFVDAEWELPYGQVRAAVLDWEFCRSAPRPVLVALSDRALHRARALALATALEGIVGVARRAWFMLWALAERWGERHEEGALLPVPINHSDLACMIGARRPSLSTALAEEDRIRRTPEGWLLIGDPP